MVPAHQQNQTLTKNKTQRTNFASEIHRFMKSCSALATPKTRKKLGNSQKQRITSKLKSHNLMSQSQLLTTKLRLKITSVP